MARRILPAYHPGEILRVKYLVPLGISAYALAKKLHVSPSRIERLAAGKTPVTTDTVLRLAKFFGTTVQYWLDMQVSFDVNMAACGMQAQLAAISRYAAAE